MILLPSPVKLLILQFQHTVSVLSLGLVKLICQNKSNLLRSFLTSILAVSCFSSPRIFPPSAKNPINTITLFSTHFITISFFSPPSSFLCIQFLFFPLLIKKKNKKTMSILRASCAVLVLLLGVLILHDSDAAAAAAYQGATAPIPAKSPAPSKAPIPAPGPPIDCDAACGRRCSETKRPRLCKRACGSCCHTCNCVPPGTYGNYEYCPCYFNLKTHNDTERKCP
ncbi:OLC1v1011041C1 [Oldenlandia corymbosa var. corymbosa]|uniref:OLC1v1011041C1 n=2 Tax=Oldenlandia corymbosa var. corymbosa TaxID=529605 RepID=A0AAV1DSR5_OLDCO|nr:OLC1v1011041C1 [Oldenlandia corymbosa var. corymbosa]